MSKYWFLPLGALFGFVLSRAGATTYDYYVKLFLFQDLQLFWVMAVAAGVGMVGVPLLKRFRPTTLIGNQPMELTGKPWKASLVPGALLFGVGWGLAGACPGTALAMLGEGKLGSLFTIAGLLFGTYIYGWLQSRAAKLQRAAAVADDLPSSGAGSARGRA